MSVFNVDTDVFDKITWATVAGCFGLAGLLLTVESYQAFGVSGLMFIGIFLMGLSGYIIRRVL